MQKRIEENKVNNKNKICHGNHSLLVELFKTHCYSHLFIGSNGEEIAGQRSYKITKRRGEGIIQKITIVKSTHILKKRFLNIIVN